MVIKLFHNAIIWQWKDDLLNIPFNSYNSSGKRTHASWMLVEDEYIKEIGFNDDIPATFEKNGLKVYDMKGKYIFPGFHDSHIHLYLMGEISNYVQLYGCKSMQELGSRVQKHAEANPELQWIIGVGWEQDLLSEKGIYPTRYDLDKYVSDRPVFLWRTCWHIALANTAALEAAEIDINKPDWQINGGSLDVENNKLTGILREMAINLVQRFVSESSDEVRKKYLQNAISSCTAVGLTAVHTNDYDAWSLYLQLQQEGKLDLRIYLTPEHREIGNNKIPPANANESLVKCNRVKIFSDGSLGAETAALRVPYIESENFGILLETDSEMLSKVVKAKKNGYRVEIHAIGDRAAEQVLTAMEKAGLTPDDRPILTHCQVLGEDLLDKMAQLGVIANIQPTFVITDSTWVDKRLPKVLQPYAYCWKSMMDRGIICAGGSDCPVETCNPLQGMYDAIFRCKKGEQDVFRKEERLCFEEALRIYTINGAFAAGDEMRLGRLKPGYLADFVVLDTNISEEPELLLKAKILNVWLNGNERDTFSSNNSASLIRPLGDIISGKNGPRHIICKCCSAIHCQNKLL